MAAVGQNGEVGVGPATRRRLAGFARPFRDHGFGVGLAETRDALSVIASSVAARPSSLKSALRSLFCATHFDWEKFDEIFDAFWQGNRMRSAQTLRGAAVQSRVPVRRVAEAGTSHEPSGLPDHTALGADANAADGRGKREGASTAENLATTDLRHITDPADIARAHEIAARLARTMRARLTRRERLRRRGRRLGLRRTLHPRAAHGGTPIDLVWRR